MTAFNAVSLRVKPGQEDALVRLHREGMKTDLAGMRKFSLVKTGERTFCIIGEWDNMASLAVARPAMIGNLDRLHPILEDLGGGLGVTEPVSGEVVLELPSKMRRTAHSSSGRST
ncbi:MAG: DUF718 domain-containing protein [Rubrivivax sp.]|nr:DUF718 domain-containing protein [Rubrivivax sp.]MCL4699082.1 hypothetical protein [Burkholderiaceae bacterium]